MNRTAKLERAVLFLLLLAVADCSAGGLPMGFTQTVGSSGATIEVSAAGDPQLAGTILTIPPGALAAETVITVSRGADHTEVGETAIGPSIRFAPDGLTFAAPATLTLPFRPQDQPSGTQIEIAVTSSQGSSRIGVASLTVAGGTVTANIAHFTDYQVLAAPGVGDGGTIDGGRDGGTLDGGRDGGPFDGGKDGGPFDGGVYDGFIYDGGAKG